MRERVRGGLLRMRNRVVIQSLTRYTGVLINIRMLNQAIIEAECRRAGTLGASHDDLIRTICGNSLRNRLSRYEAQKASPLAQINSSTIGATRKRDAFLRHSSVIMGMRAINTELNWLKGGR